MHLVLEGPVAVVVDGYLQLVGEFHSGPERNLQSGRKLPERLVDLGDYQVHQRNLRIDHYVDLSEVAVELLLPAEQVPALVESLGGPPLPVAGIVGHRELRHVVAGGHYLDQTHVGAVALHHLAHCGQPLEGQLVVVGLQRERPEVVGLRGADIEEAGLHELRGGAVDGRPLPRMGRQLDREAQREDNMQSSCVHSPDFISVRTSEVSSFMFLS